MKFWVSGPCIVVIEFDEGAAYLVGNRPWPTKKPHYVWRPW